MTGIRTVVAQTRISGSLEYLPGLVDHLHLFFAEPVFQKRADMRKTVEGDLVRIYLPNRLTPVHDIPNLGAQFLDRPFPRAGNSLKSGYHDPPDPHRIVYGL